ncbi:Vacuolar morphogenesis protein 6 [Nakaseomyces bracarensis]|uniref:Vacuolar morphogenesis protein 6 n=1 Tax=Nakaseomyces bracarensis TaxID=273131 RepID=A0ABR4NNI2_9SACH
MLSVELAYSFQSEDIADILPIYEAQKLIIAKNNGDIEVFSRSEDTIKLFQTFPGLLKIDDSKIQCKELIYAHLLGTIFVQCEKQILLLNSGNLQQYDKITERRGITNCWLMDDRFTSGTQNAANFSDTSVLAYSTNSPKTLRIFVWKNRTFQYMLEKTITTDKQELIEDVNRDANTLIITTNKSIYLWQHDRPDSQIIKVEKKLRRKCPDNPIVALDELEALTKKGHEDLDNSLSDGRSTLFSNRSITKKKSSYNIWSRFKLGIGENDRYLTRKFTYLNKESQKIVVVEPLTRSIYSLHHGDNQVPYLLRADYSEIFSWPEQSFIFDYIPGIDFLLSIGHNVVTISDNRFGVPFSVIEVNDGIKCVKAINNTHLLILTKSDCLKSYKLVLSDIKTIENESDDDSISVCSSNNNSSSFHKLWKNVVFYNHMLQNQYLDDFLIGITENGFLHMLLLRFRDLTVLFSLHLLERYIKITNALDVSQNQKKIKDLIQHFENTIISGIFQTMTNFWAPPPLVIAKTLPNSIASLVGTLTGEYHNCIPKLSGSERDLNIPPDIILKYILPYLIDIRRVIRRLLMDNNDSINWPCFNHNISVDFNFFLIDKHEDINPDSMLTLIDTVMFEIYYYYNPNMVGPFLRIDNKCSYEIVTQKLKEKKYIQELVDFYYQRQKHELALRLLTSMTNDFGNESNTKELENATKLLILQYLQRLDIRWLEVIYSYTEWLIQKFPESKQEILSSVFLNDTPACRSLVSNQVYEFIDKRDTKVSLSFLEYSLTTFNMDEEFIFTKLLKRYLNMDNEKPLKMKISSLVKLASIRHSTVILEVLKNAKSSDKNNFVKYLETIPLFQLKKYQIAIDILFDDLADYEATSDYCDKIYKEDATAGTKYLSIVFEKFLSLVDDSNIDLLRKFLQRNCLKVDTKEIIAKLPKNMPLIHFEDIISQLLKSESLKANDVILRKDTLQIELANTTTSLNNIRSKYKVISTTSKCPICKKSFTGALSEKLSWFEYKGRDMITHYACKNNLPRINDSAALKKFRTLQSLKE